MRTRWWWIAGVCAAAVPVAAQQPAAPTNPWVRSEPAASGAVPVLAAMPSPATMLPSFPAFGGRPTEPAGTPRPGAAPEAAVPPSVAVDPIFPLGGGDVPPAHSRTNLPPSLPPEIGAGTPGGERWLDPHGWERPHPVAGGHPTDPRAPRVSANRAEEIPSPYDPAGQYGPSRTPRRPAARNVPHDPYRHGLAQQAAYRRQDGGGNFQGPPLPDGPPPDPANGFDPYDPHKCPEPSHWYLGSPDPRCINPHPAPDDLRIWYTRIEFLYWKQPRPEPGTVSTDTSTNTVALNSDGLEFAYRGGTRLTLGRYIDPNDCIEFRYSSLFREASMEYANSAGGTLDAAFTTGAPGYSTTNFFGATSQTMSYGTEFHDLRLLYTHHFAPARNVLFQAHGGVRYFILNQQFNLSSTAAGGTAAYEMETHNHVFGPEFGGSVLLPIGDGRWIVFTGMGGLTLNPANLDHRVYENGAQIFGQEGSEWSVGTFTNVELGLRVAFSPRIDMRVGYELLFVSGVATAVGQVDLSDNFGSSRLMDTSEQYFLHGLNAGMTFRW